MQDTGMDAASMVFFIFSLVGIFIRFFMTILQRQGFREDDGFLLMSAIASLILNIFAVPSLFYFWRFSTNGIFSIFYSISMILNRTTGLYLAERIFHRRNINRTLLKARAITVVLYSPLVVFGFLLVFFDHGRIGKTLMKLHDIIGIVIATISLFFTLALLAAPIPWILPVKPANEREFINWVAGAGIAICCLVLSVLRFVYSILVISKGEYNFFALWGCLEQSFAMALLCLIPRPPSPPEEAGWFYHFAARVWDNWKKFEDAAGARDEESSSLLHNDSQSSGSAMKRNNSGRYRPSGVSEQALSSLIPKSVLDTSNVGQSKQS